MHPSSEILLYVLFLHIRASRGQSLWWCFPQSHVLFLITLLVYIYVLSQNNIVNSYTFYCLSNKISIAQKASAGAVQVDFTMPRCFTTLLTKEKKSRGETSSSRFVPFEGTPHSRPLHASPRPKHAASSSPHPSHLRSVAHSWSSPLSPGVVPPIYGRAWGQQHRVVEVAGPPYSACISTGSTWHARQKLQQLVFFPAG